MGDEWDYMQPKPQAKAFKSWIKSHLVEGHPIVWFPICKGDSHDPYTDDIPNGGAYDHVEPMVGIGSNHPLTDTAVYDDDWILHGIDQDLETYYRFMNTLEDDLSMQGNCKNAGAGFGKNEMYPCFYEQVTYGVAVKDLQTTVEHMTVTLDVDKQVEPNVRMWSSPEELHGKLTASGLTAGHSYTLYRYGSTESFPTGSDLSGYEHKQQFTADSATWSYEDPNTFSSHSATYYLVVPDSAVVV